MVKKRKGVVLDFEAYEFYLPSINLLYAVAAAIFFLHWIKKFCFS
jgi:hypothetical protein